jgi:uncharacterized protein
MLFERLGKQQGHAATSECGMATADFLCVRCARHMATCCQTSEIYITPGDVERIASHALERSFYEYRPPDDPVYLDHADDPIWPRYVFKRPDGTRRVLRRRDNGDCTFLGKSGCTLPLERRPLVCRLYPYDYNEQGLKANLARGCPTELLSGGESLLVALSIERADAERWHRQLYDELPLEQSAHEDRPDF